MTVTSVEHFIYGPVPKKGYSKRARSSNINPDEYERFIGYYIPLDPNYVKAEDVFTAEARLVASVPALEGVYFSKIFRRNKLDEKGRTGILTHTLLIPRSALAQGLSYYDVEKALVADEEKNGIPIGEVPKLDINWEPVPLEEEIAPLKSLISKESVNRLVDGFVKDPQVKFVVTCKGTEQKDRIKLGYMLSKLLDIQLGLVPITFMTEPPLSLSTSRCNLVLSKLPLTLPQRGWRAISSLVDPSSGLGGASSEKAKEMIEKIYSA
ncbi:MAG: hypothetical protein A4E32_01171 [Methanomassiliicoccales archaeon PtaU1.Bin124]|nr:MAG: hypothetical protein A4E32_01171 [Methanomassiliicoccales archaeon PtaU1.Bin124]